MAAGERWPACARSAAERTLRLVEARIDAPAQPPPMHRALTQDDLAGRMALAALIVGIVLVASTATALGI